MFYYIPLLKLLTKIYEVNKLNIDFAIESELFIKKIIEIDWFDGFMRILELTGGKNQVKNFLNDKKIKLTDIPIDSLHFINYYSYLHEELVELENHKILTSKKIKPSLFVTNKYVLEFISKKLTYAYETEVANIKYVIQRIIIQLGEFNKKLFNGKPLVSLADIKNYWQSKFNGDNIYHMVTQTQSIDLMEYVFNEKKADIRLSIASLSDTNRNILYYIKSVEQLKFILDLDIIKSNPPLLKDMFHQVDIYGKSVMYSWFTKYELRENIYDLLNLILPIISLDYTIQTVIPGFDTILTYFIISIINEKLTDLIQLLIQYNLINQEAEILLLFSQNKKMDDLTASEKQQFKNLLLKDDSTIENIVNYCLRMNKIDTFTNLLSLDETLKLKKYIGTYLQNNDISKLNIDIKIFLKQDSIGKTELHLLAENIFVYNNYLSNLIECLTHLSREEIKSLNLLPSLLQIPQNIMYDTNKEYILNCFNFIYYFIRENVSDDEINQILTDNETKYKPIHIYCGFGRSNLCKNIGGYLNIYYYLYGKTTAMPDFIKPIDYDLTLTTTIEVDSFFENDFDIDLIPDETNKENIPLFDHYLTVPTDEELAKYKYSYVYSYPKYGLM